MNTITFGSGDPPLLGVGGWIGNWELWQQPFELLQDRHRCIAYDHFGAGETPAPRERLTFEDQVETVSDVMAEFNLSECVLAGESNGGTVAMEVALRHPERIRALVLVDAPHSNFDDVRVKGFVHGLRQDWPQTIDAFVNLCTPEPDVEHIRRWARNILMKSDSETAAALLECMYGIDLRSRMSNIGCPTLIIHGEKDGLAYTPLSVGEESQRLIPQSSLHVVRGAGHVPTLTRAEEVASVIGTFLEAVA